MKRKGMSLRRIIHNTSGSLFITSYLVIVVLIILGAAFVMISATEGKVAERQKRMIQALYIAEGGVERALYDLRQDFVNDTTSPSWSDGDINSYTIGPNTSSFYTIPYSSTSLNGGSYTAQLKNDTSSDAIWIKVTGTLGDSTQTIQVYAKITNIFPWNNAIFAGAGASGAMVNGNVDIRGSVHILGTGLSSTDYAVDLGGTAELVGNNYSGLSSSLEAKVPALPTTIVNGETVSTLNSKLRVKQGKVGLSGGATVGEADVPGNSTKETIDASFVTNGFGGSQGTGSVYSDNGWSNGYDLGDTVTFPSLSDPYQTYATYQAYLQDKALVISDAAALAQLASVTPVSNFSYSGPNGSISMDGSGNMAISGIVYIDGGNLNMSKSGSNKTITYSGTGSILVEGNAQIDLNLVTNGDDSFPTNIMAIMTPNEIGFNGANIDVMGLFYAEDEINIEKQTDVMGTIVSNYFDMGTNVPSIFQVPDTINNLPPGLIGQDSIWYMTIVSWQKL